MWQHRCPPDYKFRDDLIGGRHPLSVEPRLLRNHIQPGWESEDSRKHWLARNYEWIDWYVDDILSYGLPILDKARTPEGVDWLYNSPEAVAMYPGNVYNSRPERRNENAIVVAMQVSNPHFEDIACRLMEVFKDEFKARTVEKPARRLQLIEGCRVRLNTPESKELDWVKLIMSIRKS